MENKVPKIANTFTNSKGQTFNNIKEIAYKKGELVNNLGKFVNETKREPSLFYDEATCSEVGVYIYQTYHNPNIAYRIYKEFAEYKFNGYNDDKLISELMFRQNKIKLSKFPTGVITLEGKIVGQEIPYFPNSVTLFDSSLDDLSHKNPIILYKKVLSILKELADNGILYLDVHSKNFMVNLLDEERNVDIIDFVWDYVKFDDMKKQKAQLYNFKKLVNQLNRKFDIINETGEFLDIGNYEEGFEQLDEMSKKLVKNR